MNDDEIARRTAAVEEDDAWLHENAGGWSLGLKWIMAVTLAVSGLMVVLVVIGVVAP